MDEIATNRREEVIDDEKLYVAVSKELKACKLTLLWALQNLEGKKLCIVYVHQPSQTVNILGGKFPLSSLSEKELRVHRERERQDMCKILDEYLRICTKAKPGVKAEKLYIEMDTVENGLIDIISRHKIERLVMGAAADNRYSRKMMEPKSNKANYVRQHAPDFCHVWFICKGRLIYTRDGNESEKGLQITKSRLSQSTTSGWSSSSNRNSRADSEGSFADNEKSSTFSVSQLSELSRYSDAISDPNLSSFSRSEPSFRSLPPPPPPPPPPPSPIIALEGISMNDVVYDQLEQAIADAEIAKREAFQESIKRRKAEKAAIEAMRQAKAAESFYYKESLRRKEIEEELAKVKEELENTKNQRILALEELRIALDQRLCLERSVQTSDIMEKELENKIISALELLQNNKKL